MNAGKFGGSLSCGCLKRERLALLKTKHGRTGTPEYCVWSAMIQRTTNEKNPSFSNYGGRGIGICKEWLDFQEFLKDMGTRPSKKHSLDRINNNLGYGPNNCRWTTRLIQNNNKRSNRSIEWLGTSWTIASLSRFLRVKSHNLQHAMKSSSQNVETAISLLVGRGYIANLFGKPIPPSSRKKLRWLTNTCAASINAKVVSGT
jgi:hypothetical protein